MYRFIQAAKNPMEVDTGSGCSNDPSIEGSCNKCYRDI